MSMIPFRLSFISFLLTFGFSSGALIAQESGTLISMSIGSYETEENLGNNTGNGLRKREAIVDISDFKMDVNPIKLSLYPNPASNFIQVRLDIRSTVTSTINLLDTNGKVLKQKVWQLMEGPNAMQFPMESYPAGRYEIILWLQGEAYSKDFVKS